MIGNNMSNPSITPNVRIVDPSVRKLVGNILGWASVALTATVIVDQSIVELDLAFITVPAGLIITGFFGLYQLLITSPNVPTV